MALTKAARAVWAKSFDDEGRWLPLWQHMDDSAQIAAILFDQWLAPNVARLLSDQFGGDLTEARTAVTFLAGVHDLGKATPAFAVQNTVLAQRMREQGLNMPENKADLRDRHHAHHAVAGHLLLRDWLTKQGWEKGIARAWGIVLGGHHGEPPDAVAERAASREDSPTLYGDGTWDRVRRELLEWMAARTGAAQRMTSWSHIKLSAQFQVLVTAVVIVADWIASNQDLFPFHRDTLPEVADPAGRAASAADALGLPRPWRPSDPPEDVAQLFGERFRLPAGASPYPIQRATCELARAMPEPGLLVVEAPMGEGKTEAALAAAEILAARWGAGGTLVALPTQATTDAMFSRVVDWLDAMGASGQEVGGSITLSHGKARFNRLFQGLVRSGALADIGRDDTADHGEKGRKRRARHAVVAHSWLSGRKKSHLANFVIGTIDQLLFGGLKSRHLMLRHLALAGKVVILDEVHAYDAYMNSYLTKVLTWLGAYRVPVVALSATLPADCRHALVRAYQRGRDGDIPESGDELEGDIGYPTLTWTTGADVGTHVAAASGRRTEIAIDTLADDLDVLVAELRDALAEGGTALIVRNRVRRVLDTADRLEREFPGEVSVHHSRFLAADRLCNDRELLEQFGSPERASSRPYRHIVVASQVVEQSLDVDFDLLVTDLAPIDLVVQRMGRLHRHARGIDESERPPKVRAARALVTGVDVTQHPPELDEVTERYVYHTYPLLRAAAVLYPRFGGTIELPGDIAPLVQKAYGGDPVGPPEWQEAIVAAGQRWRERTAARESKAEDFQIRRPSRPGRAIVGWLSANVGEADDEAQGQGQVRDGASSLEVMLLCTDAAGEWHTPPWLEDGRGGMAVPREMCPSNELAEIMASCVLRLPLTFSNAEAEEELVHGTPERWEDSQLIYRMPALVVDSEGWGEINQRPVRYTPERGLEVFDVPL